MTQLERDAGVMTYQEWAEAQGEDHGFDSQSEAMNAYAFYVEECTAAYLDARYGREG